MSKLPASERIALLEARIQSLKSNTTMDTDERVDAIRDATAKLTLAKREAAQRAEQKRVNNKISRATKPITSSEQKFAAAMARENRGK